MRRHKHTVSPPPALVDPIGEDPGGSGYGLRPLRPVAEQRASSVPLDWSLFSPSAPPPLPSPFVVGCMGKMAVANVTAEIGITDVVDPGAEGCR